MGVVEEVTVTFIVLRKCGLEIRPAGFKQSEGRNSAYMVSGHRHFLSLVRVLVSMIDLCPPVQNKNTEVKEAP